MKIRRGIAYTPQARHMDPAGKVSSRRPLGNIGEQAGAGQIRTRMAGDAICFAIEKLKTLLRFSLVKFTRRRARYAAHPGLKIEQLVGDDIVAWLQGLRKNQGFDEFLRRLDRQFRRQIAVWHSECAVGMHYEVINRLGLTGKRIVVDAVVDKQAIPAERVSLLCKVDEIPDWRIHRWVDHVVIQWIIRQCPNVEGACTPALEDIDHCLAGTLSKRRQ